ncbi:MAG: purple acid phosphatase family protein, partial [Polyangiales bacterium]
PSSVKWGSSATSLTNSADGYSFLVPQALGSGPANGIRFHEVHLCGLAPGRTYSYQVGGGAAGAEKWSAVASFTTAPATGGTDPIVIGVTGDARAATDAAFHYPAFAQMMGRMKSAGVAQTLFSGDAVYAGYDADLWEDYLTAADVYTSLGFLASAPGNHENEDIGFFARTPMPSGGKNAQRYSSYDWGLVHLVVLDDYYGIVVPSLDPTYVGEVKAWLDNDLKVASANRTKVPWIVTVHHHPFFSSTDQSGRAVERASVVAALEATFDKYSVDMDFVGHDHFYERHKPTKAGAATADGTGTTYVVLGASGAPAYGQVTPLVPTSAKVVNYDDTKNEGLYGMLTATPHTLQLDVHSLDTSGGTTDPIVDTFTLNR